MKPLNKIKINWSPNFAYAIGLITTDGNLSKDGRHIQFTSKDLELVHLFKNCLCLGNAIGKKARGGSLEKKYFVVQFGDVNFYKFLLTLGLKQAKSKTLKELYIPEEFFIDFFRGCIDGDGSIHIFKHPESVQPQLRVRLSSASPLFLKWIKSKIIKILGLEGGWIKHTPTTSIYELEFGKKDSMKILKAIYYRDVQSFLLRKFTTIKHLMGE